MRPEKFARSWETYEGGPFEPLSSRLHVTLNQRGIFLLNANVYRELGSPNEVMMMFDSRNGTIGIRAANEGESKPFPVKRHPKGSHYLIYAASFCHYYSIARKRHVRFIDPRIDGRDVLILRLDQTEPVATKVRKKREAEPLGSASDV